MKLIIGLGNPGTDYEKTRHNVGKMAIDSFLNFFDDFFGYDKLFFIYDKKNKSDILKFNFNKEVIILAKPVTYMNLSGEAVLSLKKFFKLRNNDIYIVYDDIDLTFGSIRERSKGSSGGHRGVESCIKLIGNDFNRIRIGIGRSESISPEKWVLKKFTQHELADLSDVFKKAFDLIIKKIYPQHIRVHAEGKEKEAPAKEIEASK